MQRHRYSVDEDRCACGGEIVFFEADRPDDPEGEGCEVEGIPWGTQVTARRIKRPAEICIQEEP